jgi:hypothetical protein
MKNLFKFSSLAIVIALGTSLITGCGGGGSSNRSVSTQADLLFSEAISKRDFTPSNADNRDVRVSGVANDIDSEGIYVGTDEDDNQFYLGIVDKSGNNFRRFNIYIDLNSGTLQEGNTYDVGGIGDYVYYYDANNGYWYSVAGSIDIIKISGNAVTARFNEVIFSANGGGALGEFIINGTVTYKQNDMQELELTRTNSTSTHPQDRFTIKKSTN